MGGVFVGFKKITYLEPPPPPVPSSEGFKQVIDAVRLAQNGDEALAYIGRVLIDQGFTEEGYRCFRFPPVFDVPRETLLRKEGMNIPGSNKASPSSFPCANNKNN